MTLALTDFIQHSFSVALVTIPLLYLLLVIYVAYRKFIKHSRLSRKLKYSLILSPFLFIAVVVVFYFANTWLADSRYDAWTKICGHPPVIGINQTAIEIGRSSVDGDLARMESSIATEYFCSIQDAEGAGYPKEGG